MRSDDRLGARFDDRVTGRLDAFSPGSKKIHLDIDPSSINKNVQVDLGIVGDAAHVLAEMVRLWSSAGCSPTPRRSNDWWAQIDSWRARKSLAYQDIRTRSIKPQYAIDRLYAADARAATSTSRPKSASIRCGRRSISISRSRTAG